jgi:leukotriene-A4 hydrolase
MSALLSSTDDNNDNTKTYNFKQATTIPSYLIAIAAGNLAGREIGPRSTVWCEPEVVDKAAWEFEVSIIKEERSRHFDLFYFFE